MKILVDELPYQSRLGSDRTVGELAQDVSRAGADAQGRMVISVICDGRRIEDPQFEKVMRSPLDQYERIEFFTQPLTALVEGVLTQAMQLIEDLNTMRIRAADQLAEGRQDAAMQAFQQFVSGWKQLQESLVLCTAALEQDIDEIAVGECSVPQLLQSVKEQFSGLKEAMENRDHVLVGDILRYEFDQILTDLAGIFEYMKLSCSPTRV